MSREWTQHDYQNYDSLETWRKEKTRPSPKNLERLNIHSHECKRS